MQSFICFELKVEFCIEFLIMTLIGSAWSLWIKETLLKSALLIEIWLCFEFEAG